MAQISFRFSGGFWPIILPLFQGTWITSLVIESCMGVLLFACKENYCCMVAQLALSTLSSYQSSSITWMQHLKRVFAIDIETYPDVRRYLHSSVPQCTTFRAPVVSSK
jgi:hypothetical protein